MESKCIGVRVTSQPKVQPLLADFDLKKHDFVVVETKLGLELFVAENRLFMFPAIRSQNTRS